MSHLSAERAVAPNLFDVVAHPDLAFTLMLANLMSSRLWEIRERLLRPDNLNDDTPEPYPRRLQKLLDHHFEHVTPARVADMNGVLDLGELAKRYGTPAVDFALFQIVATFNWRELGMVQATRIRSVWTSSRMGSSPPIRMPRSMRPGPVGVSCSGASASRGASLVVSTKLRSSPPCTSRWRKAIRRMS